MIDGYVEADILRTVYETAAEAGFRVHQATVQDPGDEVMMGGPWPHVVVFLVRPPWWRMRHPKRRGYDLGCALSAKLPGLRVELLLVD